MQEISPKKTRPWLPRSINIQYEKEAETKFEQEKAKRRDGKENATCEYIFHNNISNGFSTAFFNSLMNSAPTAPSTTLWSNDPCSTI